MEFVITSVNLGVGASEGSVSGQAVNADGAAVAGSFTIPVTAEDAGDYEIGQRYTLSVTPVAS